MGGDYRPSPINLAILSAAGITGDLRARRGRTAASPRPARPGTAGTARGGRAFPPARGGTGRGGRHEPRRPGVPDLSRRRPRNRDVRLDERRVHHRVRANRDVVGDGNRPVQDRAGPDVDVLPDDGRLRGRPAPRADVGAGVEPAVRAHAGARVHHNRAAVRNREPRAEDVRRDGEAEPDRGEVEAEVEQGPQGPVVPARRQASWVSIARRSRSNRQTPSPTSRGRRRVCPRARRSASRYRS